MYIIIFLRNLKGLSFIKGFFFILILDSLLIDDEPLWEPLEWSLVQTWILFIFIFTWAAEVIFSSRYGSFTNRDKKVWMGLHKTFWLIELWFMTNIFILTVFITLPFYFEITYNISYIVLWWNWYNSFFFFKFILIFSLLTLVLNIFSFFIRWLSLKTLFLFFFLFLVFLFYFFFFLFFFLFFLFFSDSTLYNSYGWVDFYNVNHGPLKWSWGLKNSDHFSYHKTPSNFWFKNDPLIASSFLIINLFLFLFFFFFILKFLIFFRLVYTTSTISFNFFTYICSSFNQFFFFFLFLAIFNLISLIYIILRFPFDFYWFIKFVKVFKIILLLIYESLSLLI